MKHSLVAFLSQPLREQTDLEPISAWTMLR